MAREERRNILTKRCRELCVHGKFYNSQADKNGEHGAWWVPRRWLIEQVGQEAVATKLQEFATAAAADSSDDEDD